MYRVFEALDELVTILEEARGLPMTSGCVVPRGDVLELLDEVRDAIPAELDDAQDVLDHRDETVGKAQRDAEQTVERATAHADTLVADAQDEAQRMVAEATQRAKQLLADAEAQAERSVAKGRDEYNSLVSRAENEVDRLMQTGRASYERAVEEGENEQARLVAQTEVVRAAQDESSRILAAAHAEVDRLRNECDAYVDGKLGEFEDLLTHTLRTVGKGRSQLRPPMASAMSASFGYRE